jgi:spore coat polysaccharide biosynthesis protein SpsF
LAGATDIFRVTSESPFLYFDPIEDLWNKHVQQDLDATFLDEIVDGTGFEIISQKALELSHLNGEDRHRSEHCSLYLREHKHEFRVVKVLCQDQLNRKDLRLTVDNPEDLSVCRTLYGVFKNDAPRFSVPKLVSYLDEHPELRALVAPFTEIGYSTMNR